MLKKHLRIAWRHLRRDRGFLINLVGLSLGLAGFIVITLFVRDELSYDRYNVNADRIFRIASDLHINGMTLNSITTPPPMAPTLKRDFPAIEKAVRIRQSLDDVDVHIGDKVFVEKATARADATLFSIFTLPLVEGDPHTALTAPNTVVLSASAAKRYFNSTDVLGKTLKFDQDSTVYTITAVMKDIPSQSHFHFQLIRSLQTRREDWINFYSPTYVLARPGTTTADIDRMLAQIVDRYVTPSIKKDLHTSADDLKRRGDHFRFYAIPLTRIHLYSNLAYEFEANGGVEYVVLFIIVGILVLLIACVNFVNLTIALSMRRLHEIGLRRVLGSSRSQLARQFLIESLLTTAIATALALIFVAVLLPWVHHLTGKQFDTRQLLSPWAILGIIGLALTVGLLSGAYPAFLLSGFQPLKSLRGQVVVGSRSAVMRTALLVFQFTVAMILVIGTGVIYSQLFYIRNKDIGYNRQQVVTIKDTHSLGDRAETFAGEAGRLPGVVNVTVSGFLPNQLVALRGYLKDRSGTETATVLLGSWSIDANYLPTLGMQLVAGRNFSPQLLTDSENVLINETAARVLGYAHPVGQRVYTMTDAKKKADDTTAGYRIIGVVRDFNSGSLRDPVDPIVLQPGADDRAVTFRLAPGDFSSTLKAIRKIYEPLANGEPFNYAFLDDDFNRLYEADMRTGKLFTIFSLLAIFIAGMGMFGLVTAATEQRTKELGIRRVLGASAADLGVLLLKGYGLAITLAILIALPTGAWVMHTWLQGFAFRTQLQPWIFVTAPLMAITVALLIVGGKARQAASANLADTLRVE